MGRMSPWGIVGGALLLFMFLLVWKTGLPRRLNKSSCVFWAMDQWAERGGYVALRRSDWGWFAHVLWSPDLQRWYGYVPTADHVIRRTAPVFFDGVVQEEFPR